MPDTTKQVTDDSANNSPDAIGTWVGDLIRLQHEMEYAVTQLRKALGR